MAGGERVTVHMSGGGPWGFRLYGGENDPLVIAKLRKHSKAAEAGIFEGDVLLGINGYSCKGLNHPTAMTLVDQAGHDLVFQMLRGSDDKHAVDAAFQALGTNLQPVPTSKLPQTGTSTTETSHHISPGMSEVQEENPILNGHYDGKAPSVKSRTQMFQQGDSTKQITTQSSQQQIGGTTITKVRREEVTNRPAMFQVSSNVGSGIKPPGTWKPSGQVYQHVNAPLTVNAGSGINVEHHPDRSVTMSFGLGDIKENIAPGNQPGNAAPLFNVKQMGSYQNKWMPGYIPGRSSAPPPRRFTPEREINESNHFSFESQHLQKMGPHDVMDSFMDVSAPFVQVDDAMKNIHLAKILYEGTGSDESGSESPGTFWMRKKKIFADSSFYDDPQHRYPTIEEQIKMARKVAMSLIAPANRNARGHRMFVKRKQKAIKWTTGMERMAMDASDEEEEKYFDPNPWSRAKGTHTWQPPSTQLPHQQPQQPPQPYMAYKPPLQTAPKIPPVVPVAPPPPPPPIENLWKPTYAPTPNTTDVDGVNPLSANEFENIRLHGQKSKHTNVPPQMAFSLSADLKRMKGKGGRLFAKQKERGEKWVVGETYGQADADPNIMEKLVLSAQMGSVGSGGLHGKSNPGNYIAPASYSGIPVNRLAQMLNPPKPSMSPWEACADFGDVDHAFTHLNDYLLMKRGNYKSAVAQNLDKAAQRSYMTPFRPGMVGVPVNVSAAHPRMPDYSQMKPWQSTGDLRHVAGSTQVGTFNPSSKTSALFRPVQFKPTSDPSENVADVQSHNILAPASNFYNEGGAGSNKDVNEEEGFCDL